MNITTLLVLISAFIIAFSICAVIIKRYLRSKQPSIESVIKDLNMPGQSIGYLSGHTVFASSYVIFSNAELVHIKINSASTPTITRIAYRDIKVVALGGGYFLHLKVQSTAGDSFKVSPVSRISITDGKVTALADTAGEYYLRYGALFKHFVSELQQQKLSQDVVFRLHWRWAAFRRVLVSIIIAIGIFAIITVAVLYTQG